MKSSYKKKRKKKRKFHNKSLMGSNLTPVKVPAGGEGSTNREANCGGANGSNYRSTGGPAAIT